MWCTPRPASNRRAEPARCLARPRRATSAADLGLHYGDTLLRTTRFLGRNHSAHKSLKSVPRGWRSPVCAPRWPRGRRSAPPDSTCDKKIGTLAVTEPQNKWWLAYNLESPEALDQGVCRSPNASPCWIAGKASRLRSRSGRCPAPARCAAAPTSQGADEGGRLRVVPDVGHQENNCRAEHRRTGGGLLAAWPARLSRHQSQEQTADVVLTLTDVRSTDRSPCSRHSKKTDPRWGAGAALFFGRLCGGGCEQLTRTPNRGGPGRPMPTSTRTPARQ